MYKLILAVLAIIAVASAQYIATPYSSWGYRTYGYAGYPVAYSGYTPYAYNYNYLYK